MVDVGFRMPMKVRRLEDFTTCQAVVGINYSFKVHTGWQTRPAGRILVPSALKTRRSLSQESRVDGNFSATPLEWNRRPACQLIFSPRAPSIYSRNSGHYLRSNFLNHLPNHRVSAMLFRQYLMCLHRSNTSHLQSVNLPLVRPGFDWRTPTHPPQMCQLPKRFFKHLAYLTGGITTGAHKMPPPSIASKNIILRKTRERKKGVNYS